MNTWELTVSHMFLHTLLKTYGKAYEARKTVETLLII
jgi:hypothetical protein